MYYAIFKVTVRENKHYQLQLVTNIFKFPIVTCASCLFLFKYHPIWFARLESHLNRPQPLRSLVKFETNISKISPPPLTQVNEFDYDSLNGNLIARHLIPVM